MRGGRSDLVRRSPLSNCDARTTSPRQSVQIVSRAGRQYHLPCVLDPSRAKTLDLREVRVVRHNATLEAEGRGGDHAICHREIPMDAPEEPCVARQPDIEGNHLQTGMLEGTQLGERLVSSTFPADRVRYFRDHDGREDASPLPAECGQLRPGSREDLFVVRGVVRHEEPGIQDLSQSSSSRDSSRIFSIRSTVVVFDRKPPRSSRRGTGRRTIASPRSSTTSRLPSSIWCRLRNSIGIVVWPLRVTLTIFRLPSIPGPTTSYRINIPMGCLNPIFWIVLCEASSFRRRRSEWIITLTPAL